MTVLFVLSVVLLLVVGGCVCVVWARMGGPRWVRAVSSVTLATAELVSGLGGGRRGSGGDDGGGDDSSSG